MALARYWEQISEKLPLIDHRKVKVFNFIVQMIGGIHLNAADDYAEGRVLDSFEFLDHRWEGVRETDVSGIHGKETDKEFIRNKDKFSFADPTSKGLGNGETD